LKKRKIVALVVGVVAVLAVVFVAFPVIRARAIVAAVGHLPNIPGCPFHASCVAALESGTLNPFAGSPLEGAFAAVSDTLAKVAIAFADSLYARLFAAFLVLAGIASLVAYKLYFKKLKGAANAGIPACRL